MVALHYKNSDEVTFGSKCVTRSQMDYFGKGLWVHSWLWYRKRKKRLKDFLELLFINNIYMKQT